MLVANAKSKARLSPSAAPERQGLHGWVVHEIGQGIVDGSIPPGTPMGPREIEQSFDVSRSVSREALRVLQSKGLVHPRQNIGTAVTERASWSLMDPDVVKWRIHSDEIGEQMRELTALRAAIEPWAAGEAARLASAEDRAFLVELADRMAESYRDDEVDVFGKLDQEFHAEILRIAANPLVHSLSIFITEALSARRELLWPSHQIQSTIERHRALADHIAQGEQTLAEESAKAIIRQFQDSVDEVLSGLQPGRAVKKARNSPSSEGDGLSHRGV